MSRPVIEVIREFVAHEAVHCSHGRCKRYLGDFETFRSGLGVKGGRFKKYCPEHGAVYYNLSKDVTNDPPSRSRVNGNKKEKDKKENRQNTRQAA